MFGVHSDIEDQITKLAHFQFVQPSFLRRSVEEFVDFTGERRAAQLLPLYHDLVIAALQQDEPLTHFPGILGFWQGVVEHCEELDADTIRYVAENKVKLRELFTALLVDAAIEYLKGVRNGLQNLGT